jgi:hypothetical protein
VRRYREGTVHEDEEGLGIDNQQFLQYDNGQNAENRMLVFYSPESLERLANAQTFFIFKCRLLAWQFKQ